MAILPGDCNYYSFVLLDLCRQGSSSKSFWTVSGSSASLFVLTSLLSSSSAFSGITFFYLKLCYFIFFPEVLGSFYSTLLGISFCWLALPFIIMRFELKSSILSSLLLLDFRLEFYLVSMLLLSCSRFPWLVKASPGFFLYWSLF